MILTTFHGTYGAPPRLRPRRPRPLPRRCVASCTSSTSATPRRRRRPWPTPWVTATVSLSTSCSPCGASSIAPSTRSPSTGIASRPRAGRCRGRCRGRGRRHGCHAAGVLVAPGVHPPVTGIMARGPCHSHAFSTACGAYSGARPRPWRCSSPSRWPGAGARDRLWAPRSPSLRDPPRVRHRARHPRLRKEPGCSTVRSSQAAR